MRRPFARGLLTFSFSAASLLKRAYAAWVCGTSSAAGAAGVTGAVVGAGTGVGAGTVVGAETGVGAGVGTGAITGVVLPVATPSLARTRFVFFHAASRSVRPLSCLTTNAFSTF